MKRLNKLLGSSIVLLCGAFMVSCGGAPAKKTVSGFGFRAFVSNPLHASANGTGIPLLEIVDAYTDVLTGFAVQLGGKSTFPGLMALSPDRLVTAVYSSTDYTVLPVDNSTEAVAQNAAGNASLTAVTLPGPTETLLYWTDDSTLFAPVATATVAGYPPGALVALNMTSATTLATLPIAGARYLAESPDGNRLLVFGDTSPTVTLVSPVYFGSSTDPRTAVFGNFDHPTSALFTTPTTAYIFECGPECGGTQARVSAVDLSQTPPVVTAALNLPAATVGLVSGSTLYVAGTPPGTPCGSGTAATTCGVLSVVDLSSLTLLSSAIITDGTHNLMQMGSNSQLFVGAHTCTNINVSGGEVRGCLSIVNATNPGSINSSNVIVAPDTGDVTGMASVPYPNINGRTVVFVCQGAKFRVYDTSTDQLLLQNPPISIVGNPTDVIIVDNPGDYN